MALAQLEKREVQKDSIRAKKIQADRALEKVRPHFRKPRRTDGKKIEKLVRESGVLDANSVYLYLLCCSHFADTSMVAEVNGKVVGFVTGYIHPQKPEVYFLWQVGVDQSMRGQGLAGKMITEILQRPSLRQIRYLETTVTPSNKASIQLFKGWARRMKAPIQKTIGFPSDLFPEGHEAEDLYRIGPFCLSQPRTGKSQINQKERGDEKEWKVLNVLNLK